MNSRDPADDGASPSVPGPEGGIGGGCGSCIPPKAPKPSERETGSKQGCKMAKFEPFLSLDCARVESGGAIQGKEGIKFCSIV